MRLFAFDLETTGVDVTQDEPVEIAWTIVDYDESSEIEITSRIIKSARPVHEKALAVHGIGPEIVATGVEPKDIVVELAPYFLRPGGVDAILGFNCYRFDIPMLNHFFARYGGNPNLLDFPVEDPAMWCLAEIYGVPRPLTVQAYDNVARRRVPFGTRYNLGATCARLGIELKDAHRAAGDLKATIEVWRKMRAAEPAKAVGA